MEIALLNSQTIRLRGKQTTLLIDPQLSKGKTQTDGTLFFSRMSADFPIDFLEGNKIIIDGAGEYEVGGVKISGYKQENKFYYEISLDNVDVLTANASILMKAKELRESTVAVIRADVLVDQAIITALNPSVLVFYGEKATEALKALGSETLSPVSKFSLTKEKIPTDTQVVLLQ